MKFEDFLKRNNGNREAAAIALMKALRVELGIHIRTECLPNLLNIGETTKQKQGFRTPNLLTQYAATHDLSHADEILAHLRVNGTPLDCSSYISTHPITGSYVAFKHTFNDLKKRGMMKTDDPYKNSREYLQHLLANHISLEREKIEEVLRAPLIAQLEDDRRTLDLMIDTGLMIPRCQPTWSNAHRGRDKIRVINHWIEDEDKYYSTRLADMEYPNISDGICPECSKELGI